MDESFLKAHSRQFCRWILSRISSECHEDDLKRPAVVFSPHFDDETLGCGGTILKKKRAGAEVKIVFMADGSKSHRHLISEHELKAIRASEGLAASRALGLKACDVFFLEFEEERLNEHLDAATDRVTEILVEQQPEEIFIPYYKEPLLWSEDHLSTNRIVVSALQTYSRVATIYGYPIWFWHCWPWTSVTLRPRREILWFMKRSVLSSWRLLRDFRHCVYIGDVLDLKRAALDQHESQMTQLIPDMRWRTLADVSNGEFLDCFFQEYEIFHRYSHLGKCQSR